MSKVLIFLDDKVFRHRWYKLCLWIEGDMGDEVEESLPATPYPQCIGYNCHIVGYCQRGCQE